jgi:GNAT superfamily N-acetyltransferase
MNFRIADKSDFEQFANLRWDFRMESGEEKAAMSREKFVKRCVKFFEEKADDGNHTYWIAEEEGEIISQIFVHKIDLIPRPCKIKDQFGYITNNYTKPKYRGKGIGTRLLEKVIEWAKSEDLELLIVYPSERSHTFYERVGFKAENEVMELTLREYYSEDWTK